MIDEKFIADKENKVLTRVTIEQYEQKFTVESVYSDENTVEMLLRCIEACAVASSWNRETVLKIMREYVDEHLPEDED